MGFVDDHASIDEVVTRTVGVVRAREIEQATGAKNLDIEIHVLLARSAHDLEALGEHRPGIEPFPLLAKRPGHSEINLAAFEELGNHLAGAAADLDLQAGEA